jgi:ketosteroid isomerase-like protein
VTAEAPIDPDTARRVAGEWFDAWNRHDLEAVLGHYADDVEFTSPFAVELAGSISVVPSPRFPNCGSPACASRPAFRA